MPRGERWQSLKSSDFRGGQVSNLHESLARDNSCKRAYNLRQRLDGTLGRRYGFETISSDLGTLTFTGGATSPFGAGYATRHITYYVSDDRREWLIIFAVHATNQDVEVYAYDLTGQKASSEKIYEVSSAYAKKVIEITTAQVGHRLLFTLSLDESQVGSATSGFTAMPKIGELYWDGSAWQTDEVGAATQLAQATDLETETNKDVSLYVKYATRLVKSNGNVGKVLEEAVAGSSAEVVLKIWFKTDAQGAFQDKAIQFTKLTGATLTKYPNARLYRTMAFETAEEAAHAAEYFMVKEFSSGDGSAGNQTVTDDQWPEEVILGREKCWAEEFQRAGEPSIWHEGIVEHGGRVWAWGGLQGDSSSNLERVSNNRIYFSLFDNYDNWDDFDFLLVDSQAAESIRAAATFNDSLLIFTDSAIYRLVGDTYSNFALDPVSKHHGCDGMRSLTVANGVVWFLHQKKLYMFDGNKVSDAGLPIQDELDGFVSALQGPPITWGTDNETWRVIHHPTDKEIWVMDTNTVGARKIAVYNYEIGGWTIWNYASTDYPIADACLAPDESLFTMDATDYLARFREDLAGNENVGEDIINAVSKPASVDFQGHQLLPPNFVTRLRRITWFIRNRDGSGFNITSVVKVGLKEEPATSSKSATLAVAAAASPIFDTQNVRGDLSLLGTGAHVELQQAGTPDFDIVGYEVLSRRVRRTD